MRPPSPRSITSPSPRSVGSILSARSAMWVGSGSPMAAPRVVKRVVVASFAILVLLLAPVGAKILVTVASDLPKPRSQQQMPALFQKSSARFLKARWQNSSSISMSLQLDSKRQWRLQPPHPQQPCMGYRQLVKSPFVSSRR